MRELNPRIDLQAQLAEQIFKALQGPVTEDIRLRCEGFSHQQAKGRG